MGADIGWEAQEPIEDVRVLKAESDEIAAGVKKNGVPVEYVLYPDEGHGFVKKENQITTSKKHWNFLINT